MHLNSESHKAEMQARKQRRAERTEPPLIGKRAKLVAQCAVLRYVRATKHNARGEVRR